MRIFTFLFFLLTHVICAEIQEVRQLYEKLQNNYNTQIPGQDRQRVG